VNLRLEVLIRVYDDTTPTPQVAADVAANWPINDAMDVDVVCGAAARLIRPAVAGALPAPVLRQIVALSPTNGVEP